MATSVRVEVQVSHVVPNLQVATAEVARKPNQSLQPPVRTLARFAAVLGRLWVERRASGEASSVMASGGAVLPVPDSVEASLWRIIQACALGGPTGGRSPVHIAAWLS